jgi:hypothetical protein
LEFIRSCKKARKAEVFVVGAVGIEPTTSPV